MVQHRTNFMPQFSIYLQNIEEAIRKKNLRRFERVNYTVEG